MLDAPLPLHLCYDSTSGTMIIRPRLPIVRFSSFCIVDCVYLSKIWWLGCVLDFKGFYLFMFEKSIKIRRGLL